MVFFSTLKPFDYLFLLMGIFLIGFAILTFFDKQSKHSIPTGIFWLGFGITMAFGTWLPDLFTGIVVLILTGIASLKLMSKGHYGNKKSKDKPMSYIIFAPAIFIPIFAFLLTYITDIVPFIPKMHILVTLTIASFIGLVWAVVLTKDSLTQSIHEGRRLIDAIGWAAILSQFLGALGALFTKAGVGVSISDLISHIISVDSLLLYVIIYCAGMTIFTIIMGNAFAAFSVITAGVAIPLLIVKHGGNPAAIGSLGLLAGFCGTLMTPMAANFNIVPAALLEMKDKYGVIKVQIPIALSILVIDTILMYTLAF